MSKQELSPKDELKVVKEEEDEELWLKNTWDF